MQEQKIEQAGAEDPAERRWRFFRDVAVFQAKLVMDGLRDLLLVPISLVAALIGLVSDPDDLGRLFRRVMESGRRSDRWINLFGDPRHFRDSDALHEPEPGMDELVDLLQQRLLEQYQRGGVAASAKEAVDRAVDAVHRASGRRPPGGGDAASEDADPRP